MKAYVNYPSPHMTIHGDSACAQIQKMQKTGQREVMVTATTFTQVLGALGNLEFAPQAAVNDAWFTIEFEDAEFEKAVAKHIHRIIGRRYARLKDAPIREHC